MYVFIALEWAVSSDIGENVDREAQQLFCSQDGFEMRSTKDIDVVSASFLLLAKQSDSVYHVQHHFLTAVNILTTLSVNSYGFLHCLLLADQTQLYRV